MSTSGQDVKKARGTMLSIRRPISFLTWPLSLWRRRSGGYKTEASTITHWDWRQIFISPLLWLLSLFGWRNNENKNSINSRENEDMTGFIEKGTQLKEVVTEMEPLKKESSQLCTRCEELQIQISNFETEVAALKSDYTQLQTENDNLRRQLNEKERKEVALKMECNQMRTRNEDQLRQLYVKEQQIDTLKKDCSQLRTRVSQIASVQLTEGNPNIADLSDQNRPDKLAEQFSELYDNQWTDCFQILVDVRKKTEEESIDILLKIVQTSYDICLDRSQNILTATKDSMFTFAGRSDEGPDKSLDTLIQEILHKLKSYRTKNFKAAPTNIGKEIEASLTSTLGVPEVDACSCFIEECIRTCWLMCIKDPPMYIFYDKEASFDKNKYMEYTEMGQEVSYVVWPALYLHKDGPLMRKGVAQGAGRDDRKRNKTVKAGSHELPEKDHIQEYHTHIEDTAKQMGKSNVISNIRTDEKDDQLEDDHSKAVCSSSDDILTQNKEEKDCQASPNNEPIEHKDEADNTLSSSNEYCQHGKSSDGSSVSEENQQRVETHNGSIGCDSGQISSSVPLAKNIYDSPSDDEQKEKLKLTTSSDDNRNEEAKGEDFQFSTKEEAMDGKEQTEKTIVSYCKQMENSRACKGTNEENQGEEKQHGLEVFSNGKEKINVVHALSEKNTYDPPQDADQEERL